MTLFTIVRLVKRNDFSKAVDIHNDTLTPGSPGNFNGGFFEAQRKKGDSKICPVEPLVMHFILYLNSLVSHLLTIDRLHECHN